MRAKIAGAAMTLLLGCQCGARQTHQVAAPSTNVIDADEIVNATGTAAPYVGAAPAPKPVHQPVSGNTREEDRDPARAGEPAPEREPVAPEEDPPIPRTGTHAEQAPAEEREVPADLPAPDAGVEPAIPDAAAPSGPLEDAGDPLPDPDAHAR